jgi:hypothetical protein
MKHQEKYIKLILEVLSEAERLVMLKEAVPYNVVKKYLQIERDPTARLRLLKIFLELQSLPNAVRLDKRGDRIALPYDPDKKSDNSIEKELNTYIKKYNFSIKDYTKGIAYDEKNKRDIKLGKVVNLAVKKETNPSIQKKIQDAFNKFNTDPKRAQASKDSSYLVVFAKHKYDIAGMSTGRNWRSCMNIIDGVNRRYVNLDIEEGTFIAYLIDSKDINIKKPFGRVLVKPYIKIDTEEEVGDVVTDGEDVINYAEARSYGQIPGGEIKFIDFVDDIMEKVQKMSGSYKRLGCLYGDSGRETVMDKKTMANVISYKIKNGKPLDEKEFEIATDEQKKKHIDIKLENEYSLNKDEFKIATDEQKKEYIDIKLENKNLLYKDEFEIATDEQKKKHIDIRIYKEASLKDYELEAATDEQKKKYIEVKLINKYSLNKDELEIATDEQKKKHIDILLSMDDKLYPEELEIATDEQKKEYIDKRIGMGKKLETYELEIATDEQKKKHIDIRLENNHFLNKDEFKIATDEQKKKHIDIRLENNHFLNKDEFEIATEEQKKKYIDIKLENEYSLDKDEFEAATDEQKKKNIDIKLENEYSLDKDEFEIATEEQKKKYIDIKIKKGFGLHKKEFEAATDEQKKEYIDIRSENNHFLNKDEFKIATDEQKKKNIDIKLENEYSLDKDELEAATDEQKKEYIDKRIENEYSLDKDELEAATDEQKKKFIKRTLDRDAYSGILDSTDLISMLTPKQEIKIGNLVAEEIDDIDNEDLIELPIETIKNVFEILPKRASSILIKALKEKEQYMNDDVKKYLKSLTIK